MIRAVIFDCFGVLATEGWIPFRDRYFGDDPEKFLQAKVLMHDLAARTITDGDFETAIAEMAGVPTDEVRKHMHANVPEERLFTYIETLKPQYKTAMLSNVGTNRLHEIFTADQLALIDVFALSSETGHVKPDPAAYRNVAEQLQIPVEACVFVDDQPAYIDGAAAIGMQTVLFQDAEQGLADLRATLADS